MVDQSAPAVKFPPPLLYLGMILLGWLLDYLFNFPSIALSSSLLRIAGSALLLAGIVINFSAFFRFKKEDENVIPWTGSDKMIGDGIYRITRNPMYLGMSLIALGIGVFVGSYAMIGTAIIASIIIDRFVIIREEEYLAERFGESYLAYKQKVGRWI